MAHSSSSLDIEYSHNQHLDDGSHYVPLVMYAVYTYVLWWKLIFNVHTRYWPAQLLNHPTIWVQDKKIMLWWIRQLELSSYHTLTPPTIPPTTTPTAAPATPPTTAPTGPPTTPPVIAPPTVPIAAPVPLPLTPSPTIPSPYTESIGI